MNISVTFNTNRHNFMIINLFIAEIMMIFLCLVFSTVMACKFGGRQQNAFFNKASNGNTSPNHFWVSFFVSVESFSSFFAFVITILCYFILFTSPVSDFGFPIIFGFFIVYSPFSVTTIAPTLKFVFCRRMFAKFRDWFNFLAFSALLCLNCIRHFFFLNKKLCLEPSGSYALPHGLSYYSKEGGFVNS